MQQGSQTNQFGAAPESAPAAYDLVTSFPGHERPLGWFENADRHGFGDEGWT